ncbi:MAG: hypothetical protein HZC36_05490 [Armatimonadetes bacterium]|nr:hypothetical protein [Armatimonadota bacterium]
MKPTLLFSLAILVISLTASLAQSGPKTPAPKDSPLTVNQIAAAPTSHLGKVTVIGIVATVTPKKGFLLIDPKEYKECGLSCLSEAGTKKIPVKWTAASPKKEQKVKVDGTLAKTEKGFSFTATKVTSN